jgi:two-component system nitrate/nitrite response regulator NarL
MIANPITVIVADDHELLLNSFKNYFKKEDRVKVVASASNGHELVTAVRNHLPQVVLTDVRMPGLDGVEATRFIKANYPHIKVIALSNYDEQNLVEDMMTVNADGYLLKNISRRVMVEAIHTVVSGKPYYSPTIADMIEKLQQKEEQRQVKNIAFTEREIEVMLLVAKGKSSKQIGKQLSISWRTVDTHRQNIYKKIGVNSPVGVALYAMRHGYLGE